MLEAPPAPRNLNHLSYLRAGEFGIADMTALVYAATAGMPETEAPRIAQVRAHNIEQDHPIHVIRDGEQPIGWYGWMPSASVAHAWESTTFFIPDLRGTGLFDLVQCRLAHEMEALATQHGADTRFFSAIAQWNTRSQAAFRSYATRHDWPQAWSVAEEPAKNRTSVVLDWPQPAPHTCHHPHDER